MRVLDDGHLYVWKLGDRHRSVYVWTHPKHWLIGRYRFAVEHERSMSIRLVRTKRRTGLAFIRTHFGPFMLVHTKERHG